MAEGKIDGRELTWRHLLPWTELFRGFQVALDLNKLLLAAAGIVAMALGWWLLSVIFTANYPRVVPGWKGSFNTWSEFKQARDHWNLMHEAAGPAAAARRVRRGARRPRRGPGRPAPGGCCPGCGSKSAAGTAPARGPQSPVRRSCSRHRCAR